MENVEIIFSVVALIVAVSSVIIMLHSSWKSRKLSSYLEIFKYLQNEDVRKARGKVIEIGENKNKKSFESWTDDDIKYAEKVCHTFDLVGILENDRLVKKGFIAKTYRRTLILCWEAVKPMIDNYRNYRKNRDPKHWDKFEMLYDKAKQL
ncbi:MAG: hypothetical protein KAJ44_03210 [Thermoplasmatales archaeon]|nr:hypothetical protein [Thermoplasmatales archaeon]